LPGAFRRTDKFSDHPRKGVIEKFRTIRRAGPHGGHTDCRERFEGRINFPITPVKGGSKNYGPSGGLVPTGAIPIAGNVSKDG